MEICGRLSIASWTKTWSITWRAATDAKRRQALIDDWQAFPNCWRPARIITQNLTNWDDEIEKGRSPESG
jgi:hypothetical protein